MDSPLQMQQMQRVTGVQVYLADAEEVDHQHEATGAVWVAAFPWSLGFIGRMVGEWAYVGRVYA